MAAILSAACSSAPQSNDAPRAPEATKEVASASTTSSCQARDIAGHEHTFYLVKPDGTVWGWGANQYPFPLGYNSLTPGFGPTVLSAIKIPGVSNATSIAAHASGACALLGDGTVSCFGAPLGTSQGPNAAPPPPSLVSVLGPDGQTPVTVTGATAVTAGTSHACLLKADPAPATTTSVWCWGDDSVGQLGDYDPNAGGHGDSTPTAVQMIGVSDAKQIAAAGFATCVLRQTGDVVCVGANDKGQLGNGTTTTPANPGQVAPIQAPTGVKFASLSGGGNGTFCASTAVVNNTQSTYCWGANNQAQAMITKSLPAAVTTPTLLGDAAAAADVGSQWAQGDSNGCEVTSSGALSCWGVNTYGQVQGATVGPVALARTPNGNVSNVFKVVAGAESMCALEGAFVGCWGNNANGELGNGNTTATTGVSTFRPTVPAPYCQGTRGQIGAQCGTLAANTCGETIDCGACGTGSQCINNVCVDNPNDCGTPGCGAGTFCQSHRCVSSCGNNPLTDSSTGTVVAGGGGPRWSFSVSSPSGYGSSGCGQQWIVEVQNARYTGGHNVFVLPTTAVTDPTVCANTKLSIATYGDGNLVQSTQTTGVWMNSGLIHGCTFGFSNNGSNELTTPSGYNTVRIVVSGQQSSVSKGTTVWSTIPVTVNAGAIPT